MSDNVIGWFAVAFRVCCNPGSLRQEVGGPGDFDHLSDEELGEAMLKTAREMGIDTKGITDMMALMGAKPKGNG